MVKKFTNKPPNLMQVLELFAGRPSALQQLLDPVDCTRKMTVASAARLLGCTPYKIKRVLK